MIPSIGVMVGFYIFTRMIEIYMVKNQYTAIRVFAILTMLVTFFGVYDLITRGPAI
jgi:hypothetical protein